MEKTNNGRMDGTDLVRDDTLGILYCIAVLVAGGGSASMVVVLVPGTNKQCLDARSVANVMYFQNIHLPICIHLGV